MSLGFLEAFHLKLLSGHSCFGPPTCTTSTRSEITAQRCAVVLNYRPSHFRREYECPLDQHVKPREEELGALLCAALWDFPPLRAPRCDIRMADVCCLLWRGAKAHSTALFFGNGFCYEKYEPKNNMSSRWCMCVKRWAEPAETMSLFSVLLIFSPQLWLPKPPEGETRESTARPPTFAQCLCVF